MEIYVQEVSQVAFDAPDKTTVVTAEATYNGGDSISLPVTATADSTRRTVTLPYVQNEGTVKVSWTFEANTFTGSEEVTIDRTYDAVTPVLSQQEILEVHPRATNAEIDRIEKATRHIINAHTGQKFGKFIGAYEVRGTDNRALVLPSRLLKLNSVNNTEESTQYFTIEGDGWILKHFPWGVPPVKADYYGLHQHVGGVIHNPNNVRLGEFYKSMTYTIDGEWGWEEVPAQVSEAAKLLVNDYACADNAYRDRYLTSMTAADWRIQFHSGAFLKTGNVRADQLLSDYVLQRGWAVI